MHVIEHNHVNGLSVVGYNNLFDGKETQFTEVAVCKGYRSAMRICSYLNGGPEPENAIWQYVDLPDSNASASEVINRTAETVGKPSVSGESEKNQLIETMLGTDHSDYYRDYSRDEVASLMREFAEATKTQ